MNKEIKLNNNITIDFLIPVASQGGVENCINMVGKYLADKGISVRVIQVIYADMPWLDESLSFYHLLNNEHSHSIQEYIDSYAAFLKENSVPNIIVATVWPLMIYVAKTALAVIDADSIVFSYLHAPFERYQEKGVGSISHLSYADLHLAISNEIADFIYTNVEDARVYRTNNPLNASNIHHVTSLDPGTLLFVGRLEKEKNVEFILRAIAKTSPLWNLRIVGDGTFLKSLKEAAKELGIEEHVEFIGWSADPWKYAEGSYALIMSSIFEGAPLVAFEALACGLPVIGNISSRVSEAVIPDKTGYIYKDNSIEDLVSILNELSHSDHPVFDPENCRQSVFDHLPEIALFDMYVKLFASANHRLINSCLYKASQNSILQEKISIVIPCYNAERYIKRCLDSIIDQTIGLDHLEINIINDCSTDSSREIIENYEKQYPDNICIIDLDKNSGQSIARNIGLSYVSGDHILFVDADDCLDRNMILQMYLISLCYPVEVVSCDYIAFDNEVPSGSQICQQLPITLTTVETDDDKKRLFMNQAFTTAPWAKLIKRSYLEDNPSIYFPEHARMEDIYYTYMLIGHASSWCHLSLPLYNYYINPNGTMKSSKIRDYYMDVHNMFSLAMDQLIPSGFYNACSQELAFMYYKKAFIDLTRFMLGNFNTFPVDNYRILRDYMMEFFPNISQNKYLSIEDKKTILEYLKLDA